MRSAEGIARYLGLMMCGSIWACPVCSATIRERRAQRVEEICTVHLVAGHRALFVTLTLRHGARDSLSASLGALRAAWALVSKNGSWRRLSGLLGSVRATEITHGRNGWHPHLHLLVFVRAGGASVDQAEDVLMRLWPSAVEVSGGGRPDQRHGIRVQEVVLRAGRADVGAYLGKLQDGWSPGRELTRGDLKRGRKASLVPFEILELAAAELNRGRPGQYVELWREFERETHGLRCMEWSRSAVWKAHLAALGIDEDTDDDQVEQPAGDGDIVVADFTSDEWAAVIEAKAEARLLDVAERSGSAGTYELIAECVQRRRRRRIVLRT